MTKHTILRRSIGVAAGGLVAATLLGGSAASAAPSTTATQQAATSTSATSYTLYPGWSAYMPTWAWGGTNLCTTNYGGSYGYLKVQSYSPYAGPEYVSVPGYSTRCINRWWWGVPLTVSNVGNTALRVTGS